MFYGIGDVGNALVNSAVQFFLLIYFTDGALLPPALVGSALLIGKIWDAVIDPFIGYFSDRTKSRWGRRRVYILFFAIPFGIAFVLMFRNPGIEAQTGKFIWTLLTYIFFCTVYS